MLSAVRLPFSFDAALLRRDLAAAEARIAWEKHFNAAYYFGEWSGIALRGNSPIRSTLGIDPEHPETHADLATFDACPYVREVIGTFQTHIRSVRFLKLAPAAGVNEHRDNFVGFDHDEMRVHVPVLTSPDVDFIVAGEPIVMQPGECWYVNVDQPHSVLNRGTTPRVHLIFDVAVNDWVRTVILSRADGEGSGREPAALLHPTTQAPRSRSG